MEGKEGRERRRKRERMNEYLEVCPYCSQCIRRAKEYIINKWSFSHIGGGKSFWKLVPGKRGTGGQESKDKCKEM